MSAHSQTSPASSAASAVSSSPSVSSSLASLSSARPVAARPSPHTKRMQVCLENGLLRTSAGVVAGYAAAFFLFRQYTQMNEEARECAFIAAVAAAEEP